jgi:hypothetical protein
MCLLNILNFFGQDDQWGNPGFDKYWETRPIENVRSGQVQTMAYIKLVLHLLFQKCPYHGALPYTRLLHPLCMMWGCLISRPNMKGPINPNKPPNVNFNKTFRSFDRLGLETCEAVVAIRCCCRNQNQTNHIKWYKMHYINWCLQENKHLNMEYDF